MPEIPELLEAYANGPQLLLDAVRTAQRSDWDAAPIPGKWTIREVVCHLADSEIVYADRMKRVLAEDHPTVFEADPDLHVPALCSRERKWQTEMNLIEAVRFHMLPILKSCDPDDFQRTCVHSIDGPMTLETLLDRITLHIPHHILFIEEKLKALGRR